ncbi:hypothetical protein [Fimbriiglobus ruber]|uniref:hypothetical protein n=1 Tax=Fimbriiglobus ruber TaxID=1908690 RepID=UPI00117B0663|nr:hypothetical protein [Fimbriiglobus ruber]
MLKADLILGGMAVLRVAVTYYLALVLIVGPAANCCCVLGATAAPYPVPTVSSPLSTPVEVDGRCPHCKKHQQTPPSGKSQDQEKNPRCPCQEQQPEAITSDTLTDLALGWSLDQVFSVCPIGVLDLSAHDMTSLAQPQAVAGLRDGPWLSASDLISAHHVIRC